jgi:hypothetical protein
VGRLCVVLPVLCGFYGPYMNGLPPVMFAADEPNGLPPWLTEIWLDQAAGDAPPLCPNCPGTLSWATGSTLHCRSCGYSVQP